MINLFENNNADGNSYLLNSIGDITFTLSLISVLILSGILYRFWYKNLKGSAVYRRAPR